MKAVVDYVTMQNQRFYCKDNKGEKELTVTLTNRLGKASGKDEIDSLCKLAGKESAHLEKLYQFCNGADFQINGGTIGLRIAAIEELEALNMEWKDSFSYYEESDLYDFQKGGFAFAEIYRSGNYFVLYNGKVFYSNHDDWDDASWGNSIEEFLTKAFSDPVRFLKDAGCYTRYYDGKTDTQYIPEKFLSGRT